MDSLQIAQGTKVAEFEAAFCAFAHRRYAAAVSSGTAALSLALLAMDLARGDEVIVPSYTCAALLHALQAVRATPVVVDIDPVDFNISGAAIKKRIRKRTRAVIVPHAFGRAARITEILDLGVEVIEDGTQALGASVESRPVGSFGLVSVFSFYATKMITTGEGGMVLTDSRKIAEKVWDTRDYDKKSQYRFRTNSKMTDLEAALGIEQLKKLPQFIARRREIALDYDQVLRQGGVSPPPADGGRDHVYYRYLMRVPGDAARWIRALSGRGVDAKPPVFKPLHRYLGLGDRDFPDTRDAMKQACSLPIYPSLTREECGVVSKAVLETCGALGQGKRRDKGVRGRRYAAGMVRV